MIKSLVPAQAIGFSISFHCSTVPLNIISVSEPHISNRYSPILVKLLGKVIVLSELHPVKASPPIDVTPSGITKFSIDEHPSKALLPIDFKVSGSVILLSDWAKEVAKAVANGEFDRGILVCGTGLGMSITANKIKGIRAVSIENTYSARVSRAHNNSNVLCLGERVIGDYLALDIVDIWLKTGFEGGRHKKRIDMIE